MKIISSIFVLLLLSAIVEGAFWTDAAWNLYQPIILSFGTIFASIGLDNNQSFIRDVALFNKKDNIENNKVKIDPVKKKIKLTKEERKAKIK